MFGETTLQMVQRHVREDEVLVHRQREIVAKFIQSGLDARMAEDLLAMLEYVQGEPLPHVEPITSA